MRTHRQIIKDVGGPAALSEHLGLSINTATAWRHRASIPATHWLEFQRRGWASLEELAAYAAQKLDRETAHEADPNAFRTDPSTIY